MSLQSKTTLSEVRKLLKQVEFRIDQLLKTVVISCPAYRQIYTHITDGGVKARGAVSIGK